MTLLQRMASTRTVCFRLAVSALLLWLAAPLAAQEKHLEILRGKLQAELEDHAIYMIVYSDNTSTNVLIDVLGMDAVNALSASLGARHTRLARKMQRPEASVRGDENLSTPRDAALIMERIASCDLPMS